MHINCVNVADMFSGYMFITDLWTNFFPQRATTYFVNVRM